MHLAQPQVGARVERAPVGDGAGAGQQPVHVTLAARALEAGEATDLLGHLVHLLAGLEEALGVAAVDVTPVEGDQPPGRVEDVDDRGVAAVGVAHGVGEHRADPLAVGEPGHPGGVGRGAGTPLAGSPGAAAAEPVGDQLDEEVLGRHHFAPRSQRGQGQVVAAPGDRRPDLGGRPEQHRDRTG